MSLESRLKISKAMKGVAKSELMKQRLGTSRRGIRFSEEHKKKLRENHVGMKGMRHSEETKEKIRRVAIGRKMSIEARLKISGSNNHN